MGASPQAPKRRRRRHASAAVITGKQRGKGRRVFCLLGFCSAAVVFLLLALSSSSLQRMSMEDSVNDELVAVVTKSSRNKSDTGPLTTTTTQQQQERTPQMTTPTIDIPRWMRAHVEFQQMWIDRAVSHGEPAAIGEDNRTRRRPPLLMWTCPAAAAATRGRCGGLGDRLYGIIMGLYVAVLTRRIYLIQEWKQQREIAHPLWDYVQPRHLCTRDNATTVLLNATTRRDVGLLSTLDDRDHPLLLDPCGLRADTRDYFLRNNIMTYETQLAQSECLQEYWKDHGGRRNGVLALSHVGFWTLFQFTERVHEQARNILRQARIVSRRHRRSSSHSTVTTSATPLLYLAIHVRTGQGKTWDDPDRHAGIPALEAFDACAVRLQTAVRDKCAVQPDVYVASDNARAKVFFRDRHIDQTFKSLVRLEVFHIDRTDTEMLNDVVGAYDRVWGELKVLIDAACLVMSHSKFSTLAMELSFQQPRCAVYFDECDEDHVRRAVANLSC